MKIVSKEDMGISVRILCVIASVLCSIMLLCGAKEKKIKTVPMSYGRYLEMTKSLEAAGHYVFWDHEVALIVTNMPEQVGPPIVIYPAGGGGGDVRKKSNKVIPREPAPYRGQVL